MNAINIGRDTLEAMEAMIVRKDHLVCTKCATIEPLHPGDGTPAPTFVWAIILAAQRHRKSELCGQKKKEGAPA